MLTKLNGLSIKFENDLKRLLEDKRFIHSVISTFLIGLIAHGYAFANLNLNHDSLNEFFVNPEWKIQLGRYFSPLYTKLTGTICVYPWSNGLLGLLWMSLSVYLIVKLFDIKKMLNIVLLTMILTVNKTVTVILASYTHEFSSYMFALLLSCLAAYVWKNKKDTIDFLITISLLTISIGIYQAYLATFVMIVIIFSIKEILVKKDVKNIIKNGLIAIAQAILSCIVYYVLFKIVLKVLGIVPLVNGYNSINNISGVSSNLLVNLMNTYKLGLNELFIPSDSSINNYLYNSLNVLLLSLIVVITYVKADRKISNLVLTTVLFLIIPFVVVMMRFASGTYHDLMGYSLYVVLILTVVLIDLYDLLNIKKMIITLLVIAITFFNIQTANACYSAKAIQDKSTFFYMTDLISKLEEYEEYHKYDSKVAIVGYFFDDFQMKELKSLTLTGLNDVSGITYYDCWNSYFENVLNYPINLVGEQESAELALNEEVKEMPIFPHKGSIKLVDDIVVIKLQWAE